MNFYMAFGTIDFLRKLEVKHHNKNMTGFYNNETAILLHETTKKSVFAAPRKYEVITGSGELISAGFLAMTYVPVSDEGKPIFENNITQMNPLFQNTPGLVAFRALRPIKNDTYVIASFWVKEPSYSNWTHSKAYNQLEQTINKTKAGVTQTMFTGPVYTKTYYVMEDE